MCGIIGYVGHRPAIPVIIEGLRRLEYRGYDSAGVAYMQGSELATVRAAGKLNALEEKLAKCQNMIAIKGIGHTRWATHGIPAERNAHPQLSNDGELAIIHNGIIENYQEIKNNLLAKGYVFYSETDTEVLVNLIAEERKNHADLLNAFAAALRQAHGAYAVALIAKNEADEEKNTIFAARMSAPLIIGVGTGENFVASDIPAFLPYTRDVIFLEDGEVVKLNSNSVNLFTLSDLSPIKRATNQINWDMQSARKGGFKHFMLKEIFEQPKVITDCLTGRIGPKGQITLPELENLNVPKRLHIVACGTSFHAGLWARHLIESWAKIPATLEIASEFRYRSPMLESEDMVLVISQSGETADTLAALRLAKTKCTCIGLCNVVGSSIARDASAAIFTQAGPEISVASTKAMCSQMTVLSLLAMYYGQRKKVLAQDFIDQALQNLRSIPAKLEASLPDLRTQAQSLAREYADAKSFFFLGRGEGFALALEGALKLKELSYIHAEGYAAGEMKHGPIALIDQDFPTFAVALDNELFPKAKSNIVEVQARLGKVIALVNPGHDLQVNHAWELPKVWGPWSAFFALPAMQLFSYEMADYLGKDVDQPRNLAKSVTVE